MQDAFAAAVRQAFHEANATHDCTLTYTTRITSYAALSIAQCIVSYESGNEFFRLDTLIESFRRFGEIARIEFRGRGGSDATQLLFEFIFDGKPHQVIYVLPNAGKPPGPQH